MKRNGYLDAYRGFSLVSMLFFHGYYDLVFIFSLWTNWLGNDFLYFWQQTIVLSFIFVSGSAVNYTKHLARHGLELNLLGLLITAITYFIIPRELIIFGVLNFLGTAMLLTAGLRYIVGDRELSSVQRTALFMLCLAGFVLTEGLPSGYIGLYGFKLVTFSQNFSQWGTFLLGLPTVGISSADYVPVLPHIFVFWLGILLWPKGNSEQYDYQGLSFLQMLGRHSLFFYLCHQIVLYGVLWCFVNLFK